MISWLAVGGCARPVRPEPAGLTDRTARWRADLDVWAAELPKRHKNLFFHLSRDDFEKAVARLDADLPALADHQIVIRMMQIVASVGDGHTRVRWTPGPTAFPVEFARFSDGVFLVRTVSEHRHALGARLLRIHETVTDEVLTRVATALSRDNDEELYTSAPRKLNSPEWLHALGIIPDLNAASFELERPGGERLTLQAAAVDPRTHTDSVQLPDPAVTPLPWSRLRRDQAYWFEFFPEQSTLYIAYNSCVDRPDRPFRDFADEVLAAIARETPRRVVVDLRNNSGGDSQVARPLIAGLGRRSDVNQPGRLFVLIGRRTYSSALMNAASFRRETRAVLVGEPTGGKPNAYGEVRTFDLPNSGITVSYSTKYFRTDRDSDPPSLFPDLRVETSSSDYFAGRDPVMQAVFDYAAPVR
jgi:hypothetical protein